MKDPIRIIQGDCREALKQLPDGSAQCCVTSPPYWGLRDYSADAQLGLERTPEEYVTRMVEVFREVKRVLRDDGTLWLNLGDSYAGSGKGAWDNKNGGQKEVYIPDSNSPQTKLPKVPEGLKPKDLVGIPWRVAFALQADGWWLRSDIIWGKPNAMPESVTDRPTRAHEYLFLLTKSARYHYDAEAIQEPVAESQIGRGGHNAFRGQSAGRDGETGPANRNGRNIKEIGAGPTRNKRSVWSVATNPYPEAHFATFPPNLIKPCILAGTKPGDIVLDPFGGSGTTGMVALELGRRATLIELNPDYCGQIRARCNVTPGLALA